MRRLRAQSLPLLRLRLGGNAIVNHRKVNPVDSPGLQVIAERSGTNGLQLGY
jgi:hypothetical protein